MLWSPAYLLLGIIAAIVVATALVFRRRVVRL